MQPSIDQPTGDSARAWRRYGPIVAVLVVVAVVAGVVLAGGKAKKTTSATSSPTSSGAAPSTLTTGAISYSEAQKEGKKIDFGPTCDTSTGHIAMPDFVAPECYAPLANNGASAPGVTATSINVVLYEAEPNDPVINYVEGAIKDPDTPAQVEETYRGYVKLFEHFYNTYGRKVNLEVLHASGLATDEVAARADAVKAATQLNAFAVWGGPALTTAWADELGARHVVCLGCTAGNTPDWFTTRPTVFPILESAQQAQAATIDYLTKEVAGRPASHAGDPAFTTKPRKFGYLYINTDVTSAQLADQFTSQMSAKGYPMAATVAYTLDPARLQEQAASVIAKMKSAGVTTVIFSGDPVAPATFTKEATAQQYFPEWVLAGTVLADTTAFARTYDQKQWAHAFGFSALTARIALSESAPYKLYQWGLGTPPPAAIGAAVIYPQPSLFYRALQAAGPSLTPDNFRLGIFAFPRLPEALTQAEITFGNVGIWPYTDYNGIDDGTEVWWNPTATGPDEVGRNGTGMYEYVEGGARYVAGQWPSQDSKAFVTANAVTIYATVPPSETPKQYPSPSGL